MELGPWDICPSCGAVERLETNEPQGRANSMTPQVRQCRYCHRWHTDRQLRYGFDLEEGERTPLDRQWALFMGVPLVLAKGRYERRPIVPPTGEDFELLGRACSVLLELIGGEEQQVRHPGPDPLKNDSRASRAIRKGILRWKRRPLRKAHGPKADNARAVATVLLLCDFMTALDLPGDEGRWSALRPNAPRLVGRLNSWTELGITARLYQVLIGVQPWLRQLLRAVLRLERLEQRDLAVLFILSFPILVLAAHTVRLLEVLATTEEDELAEQAAREFLEVWELS
jgi:hypothetical protein